MEHDEDRPFTYLEFWLQLTHYLRIANDHPHGWAARFSREIRAAYPEHADRFDHETTRKATQP